MFFFHLRDNLHSALICMYVFIKKCLKFSVYFKTLDDTQYYYLATSCHVSSSWSSLYRHKFASWSTSNQYTQPFLSLPIGSKRSSLQDIALTAVLNFRWHVNWYSSNIWKWYNYSSIFITLNQGLTIILFLSIIFVGGNELHLSFPLHYKHIYLV